MLPPCSTHGLPTVFRFVLPFLSSKRVVIVHGHCSPVPRGKRRKTRVRNYRGGFGRPSFLGKDRNCLTRILGGTMRLDTLQH